MPQIRRIDLKPGQEIHQSQASVARRTGLDAMSISRAMADGRLKPVGHIGGGAVYNVADLNRLSADYRAAQVKRLMARGPAEREKLIAEMTAEHARLAWREVPNDADRARAASFVDGLALDAKLAVLEMQTEQAARAVADVQGRLASLRAAPVTMSAEHRSRLTLKAERVDTAGGVLHGVTVAVAGVQALGKYVFLNQAGAVTRDPKQAVKKLPIYTDEKTLSTLMSAVSDAGGRLKVREDHDDSIGARAGFADSFALSKNGTVTADIHLFESYRNRPVVIETAEKTPDKIGLSIDFEPTFELAGDKALMRVASIEAVDVVDAGAITPNGLR